LRATTMKDTTRRHETRATAEMTIIRADKIAFDERALPFAPARRGAARASSSLALSLAPTSPPPPPARKSIAPETQRDRKLDAGDQRRAEEGPTGAGRSRRSGGPGRQEWKRRSTES